MCPAVNVLLIIIFKSRFKTLIHPDVLIYLKYIYKRSWRKYTQAERWKTNQIGCVKGLLILKTKVGDLELINTNRAFCGRNHSLLSPHLMFCLCTSQRVLFPFNALTFFWWETLTFLPSHSYTLWRDAMYHVRHRKFNIHRIGILIFKREVDTWLAWSFRGFKKKYIYIYSL